MKAIKTKRLRLELVSEEHVKDIYEIYSSEQICKYYDIEPFEEMEDSKRHIERWHYFYEKGYQVRYVIILNNVVIGTCGLYSINRRHGRACIGYELKESYWGHGYAKEAVASLMDNLQEELDLVRIQAEVMPDNNKSIKLLENLGFNYEGELKSYEKWGKKGYVDLLMYSKIYL